MVLGTAMTSAIPTFVNDISRCGDASIAPVHGRESRMLHPVVCQPDKLVASFHKHHLGEWNV